MGYKFIGSELFSALDLSDPSMVVSAIFNQGLVDGSQPHSRWTYITRADPHSPWQPDNSEVLASSCSAGGHVEQFEVVEGAGWTALKYQGSSSTKFTVNASTVELALDIIEQIKKIVQVKPERIEGTIKMGFWRSTQSSSSRAHRDVKRVAKRPWNEIERNYPAKARKAIDTLMKVNRETLGGKLLLLYGPPGTGKTNVLASLAHEWKQWCDVDSVLDPEVLFTDAGYLHEMIAGVASDESDDDFIKDIQDEIDKDNRHRMIIVEDCDELIRAGEGGGQALARLLNVTDGLLGQSSNLLIAITTNEDISALHPAVTRPGRCMAQIEVGRLSPSEAVAWLGTSLPSEYSDGATLAELYFLKSGTQSISAEIETQQYGQYL